MRKKLYRFININQDIPDDDLLHICQDDSCLRLDLTTYNIGLGASYSLFFDAYTQAKQKCAITPDFAAFVDSFLTSPNDFNFSYPFHTEGDDYYFNYEEDEERIYLWLNVKTATITKFTKGGSLMDDNNISTAESSSALTDETNDGNNDTALMPTPISAVTSETSDTPIVTITEQSSIERLTVEIQFHLNQLGFHVIEVGKRLILAKKLVPHGEWANWLKNNFNLKRQSATNFMHIAERFGANSQTFGNIDIATFKPSQLIALLALPKGEEETFIAQKAAEGTPVAEMPVKKLRSDIKKYNADLANDDPVFTNPVSEQLNAHDIKLDNTETSTSPSHTTAPPNTDINNSSSTVRDVDTTLEQLFAATDALLNSHNQKDTIDCAVVSFIYLTVNGIFSVVESRISCYNLDAQTKDAHNPALETVAKN